MLKGNTAIVTGSTSGIGLGIARALAGAGANLVINGFGEAAQIERLREGLAAQRQLVLKGPNGKLVSLAAGPEVRNFEQIKVGDQVEAV